MLSTSLLSADTIEQNTENVLANVESANEELIKAASHQVRFKISCGNFTVVTYFDRGHTPKIILYPQVWRS